MLEISDKKSLALIRILKFPTEFSTLHHVFINWSVLTTVSITSTQLLWKERCLNTSCFVFFSSSHALTFFFPPLSLSLIPPKSALMAKPLLCFISSNHFLSRISVLGFAMTMVVPLLIRKQSIGRRVVIAAHGMGSVVIW